MDRRILPRDAAAAFELKEGTGPIIAMYSCGQFIEMYKIDKTFRIQSPQNIDPEGTNPNALWVTTPISDIGTKNPIISRILLQSDQILNAAWFRHDIDKEQVKLLLHKCKEHLLVCDKIAKKIAIEIDEIILKIKMDGISVEKNARGLNPFPHVTDLSTECGTFLMEAKRTIKVVCELAGNFYTLPRDDNNFDNLAVTLSTILEHDAPLLDFLSLNSGHIKHIIDMRNFYEHSKKENKTIIENFRCTPDTQIVVPQWYVLGEEPTPIKEEMSEIVTYLMEVVEAMLIHLVMGTVKKEIPFIIEEISESKINLGFPIKYRLSIALNRNFIIK